MDATGPEHAIREHAHLGYFDKNKIESAIDQASLNYNMPVSVRVQHAGAEYRVTVQRATRTEEQVEGIKAKMPKPADA